jgi:hypothetical protein
MILEQFPEGTKKHGITCSNGEELHKHLEQPQKEARRVL